MNARIIETEYPELLGVVCATCGRVEVLDGAQPAVPQLVVFELLHADCRPAPAGPGHRHAVRPSCCTDVSPPPR